MNKAIKGMIIVSLLLQANFLLADIYRSKDAKGNISYSDKRTANAIVQKPNSYHQRYKNKVIYVYDGDTVKLENGEKVRLLGIDTPEVTNRYHKGVAGGEAAKKWLKKQIEGTDIYLEYDLQHRDKYHRLLAYIFLENGQLLNTILVKKGLAIVNLFPPDLRYQNELLLAQQQAQQQHLGMWAMKRYQLTPVDKIRKVSGWKRYIGMIKSVKNRHTYVQLMLGKKLKIKIAKKNLYLFHDLESYNGRTVEVRGWPTGNRPPFSILVRHPSALLFYPE